MHDPCRKNSVALTAASSGEVSHGTWRYFVGSGSWFRLAQATCTAGFSAGRGSSMLGAGHFLPEALLLNHKKHKRTSIGAGCRIVPRVLSAPHDITLKRCATPELDLCRASPGRGRSTDNHPSRSLTSSSASSSCASPERLGSRGFHGTMPPVAALKNPKQYVDEVEWKREQSLCTGRARAFCAS
jgi:hypothetical protein